MHNWRWCLVDETYSYIWFMKGIAWFYIWIFDLSETCAEYDTLMRNLCHYAMKGLCTHLLKAYLRVQRIFGNGTRSESELTIGVVQYSCLGLFLFYFVFHLHKILTYYIHVYYIIVQVMKDEIVLFTDDTNYYNWFIFN